MPRRAKPASAEMNEFIEGVSLNKSERQQLLDVILTLHRKYPIKANDIRLLAKSRLREKSIGSVTESDMLKLEDEIQGLTKELEVIEGRLPIILKLNGVEIDGFYTSENDHELCQRFFTQIEHSIADYVQDRKFDVSRPNKSEVVERLRLLKHACEPLENALRDIDDYTRAFVQQQLQLDVDLLVSQIGDLASGYDLSKAIDAGKKNTATLNLCVSVVKAIQGIGLRATTSREGLLETFIQKLFFVINKTEVPQIQKIIRAALIVLK